MPDLIEAAKTGRSKCRGCGEKIAKDALRFGEEVPNPFADEEDAMTTHWMHVACAADKRPEKFLMVLEMGTEELPDHDQLQRIAQLGVENPELVRVLRAERSPSGRAKCRQCRELIEKDALRIAIEPDADVMSMANAYYIHASCAIEKVGETGLLEKLERVSEELNPEDIAELRSILSGEELS